MPAHSYVVSTMAHNARKQTYRESLGIMERRHQTRSLTNTPTRISYEPLGIISAHIRNFSQNGLFVELDPAKLKLNHTVEIIAESLSYMRAIAPVKAIIVRSTPKGIGLSFLEPCPRLIDTLSSL